MTANEESAARCCHQIVHRLFKLAEDVCSFVRSKWSSVSTLHRLRNGQYPGLFAAFGIIITPSHTSVNDKRKINVMNGGI